MSTSFPTPWAFEAEDEFEDTPIRAANGEPVLVRDNGVYPPDLETCREIVDAVNERDKFRDLARMMEKHLRYIVESERPYDAVALTILREARAAIGKDKE